MKTPIHAGVMPSSGASTGASTAGAEAAIAVKIWMASVAASDTRAVRFASPLIRGR